MAIKSKLFFLSAIAAMLFGCSPDKQAKAPDNLIGLWNMRFSGGQTVLPKVTSVAYNPLDSSAIMAFEPAPPGEANLLKMRYDPNKKDVGEPLKVDITRITNGSLRQIRVSPSGKYTAVSGRTRELVLLKDQLGFAKFELEDELTRMEFGGKNENILAVGDRKGRLILIDLETSAILNTVQIFEDEVTSLAFYKENHVLVTGNDSRIIQVDILSGKTTRIIETLGIKEKILHATGLRHCYKERINQVLYIAEQDKVVTSHGWDYCSDLSLAVWDASNGNLVKEIRQIKSPVHQMVWVSKLDTLVVVDHDQNLWRLSLNDYKLSGPIHLPQTLAHFTSPKKNEPSRVLFGHVQSMISIPGTNLLLIATGSYFKGGSGVLLTELGADSMKHVARLVIDIGGFAHLFVREDLFSTVAPS